MENSLTILFEVLLLFYAFDAYADATTDVICNVIPTFVIGKTNGYVINLLNFPIIGKKSSFSFVLLPMKLGIISYVHRIGGPLFTVIIIGASLLAIFGRMPWPALFSLGVFVAVFFGAPQVVKKITGREACCLLEGQMMKDGKCVAAPGYEFVGTNGWVDHDRRGWNGFVAWQLKNLAVTDKIHYKVAI